MRAEGSAAPATVRRLEASEWRAYRTLRLAALTDAPEAFGSTLEREQAQDDAGWQQRAAGADRIDTELPLVAVREERFVGLLWARVDGDDRDTVHLYQMWVAPDARGRGIGAALLGAAIRWARQRGARCMRLGVTEGDTPARRLYQRAGFQVAGPAGSLRPGSPLRGVPMELRLGA